VTSPRFQPAEQRVTPLELFFDLVFVFAITRVTSLMAHDLSWTSLVQGLLVLAALWWGWSAYAWLTNHVAGDDFRARLVVFLAMASMVLVALAVPEAFGDHALLFALAYLVMRMAHLGLYWVASREEHEVHVAVARLLPSAIAGPLLLVAAAFADGGLQAALWLVALAIDYGGPLVTGVAGYNVHPAHFAERFSLIVIIALGESIVAIGVGASGHPLDPAIGAAAVLALVASAGLWWAYFDVVAPVAHRRLAELSGAARNTLARDSFAYLHLPMIAGIELFALGVEQVVGHVDEALKLEAATALFGGIALYLLGHVAFKLRNAGGLNHVRLLAAIAAIACVPLATELNAVAALALACGLIAVLIAYETVRFSADRARVRMET
jgi:low temperature requirement protein LtrA